MNHTRWLLAALALAPVVCGCGSSTTPPVAAAGTDAGAADSADVASGEGDAGGAIVAPDDQWTWVDFPDSKCASGTPTGIAVNPHAGATDLVIYLEGGGACTDAASCWGPSPAATNLAGYDASTFASAAQLKYPLLDRTTAGSPMVGMNMVYVPYCTGDMHGGSTEVDLTEDGGTMATYFWGATDMQMFLTRLVPTFIGTAHVWLYGTSAGGFGTMLDYDAVARAFGVRVDIIDDSGPPIAPMGASDNAGLFGVWGYIPPAACTSCTSLRAVYDFDRQEQPGSRYAFLSFAEDTTISVRFGYTVAEFPAVVDMFSSSIASDPNAATFIVTNEASHVVETDSSLASQYLPWITEMVTDAPWADTTYAHP